MFLNWLLTVFPAQMAQGWLLVRRDLVLWIALFTLMSLAAVTVPNDPAEGFSLATLVHTATALLATLLPAILFRAASRSEEVDWSDVLELIGRRMLPLLLYSGLGVFVVLGASSLVGVGAFTLLNGTPLQMPVTVFASTLVLITLLVRLCFLPFFAVLHTNADLPELGGRFGDHPLLRTVAWPLLASSRLGEHVRWSVTPYVIISRLGPLAALTVPTNLLLPFLVVWQIFMLVAQAVLYNYFDKGCARMGVKARSLRRVIPTSPGDGSDF